MKNSINNDKCPWPYWTVTTCCVWRTTILHDSPRLVILYWHKLTIQNIHQFQRKSKTPDIIQSFIIWCFYPQQKRRNKSIWVYSFVQHQKWKELKIASVANNGHGLLIQTVCTCNPGNTLTQGEGKQKNGCGN